MLRAEEMRGALLTAVAGPLVSRRTRSISFGAGETFEVARNDRSVVVSVRVSGFSPLGLSFLFSNGATPVPVRDNVGENVTQIFTLLPGDQLFATTESSGTIQVSEAFFA